MYIKRKLSNRFDLVASHVKNTYESLNATGAAAIVIHKDKIVKETYWGRQSKALNSRAIQEDTQFHVASVRKSYIGFAIAYAIHKGYIASIDDQACQYLPSVDADLLKGTKIRHLLTHTHGLRTVNKSIIREFLPGESWAYRDICVDLISQIIKNTTGKTIADIVFQQVIEPLSLKETGWYGKREETFVEVIREPNDPHWYTSDDINGDKMNMYVSARELAYWGYLHLKKGFINGKQIVAKDMLDMATSLQSPKMLSTDFPQNGFFWFVKDLPAKNTEIGELVPKGAYQILGYTGAAVLVIPEKDLVVVRMFNSFGSPAGFDYLEDIRSFGNAVMACFNEIRISSTMIDT
ncbi:serine hydrolase domain-containing protein [Bacillus chungangensis]|uniref:CubicO group peptidase (Beta-lactamase class C family) n=1 Tax=Bacillus chungangensis TaxID=587633 RepID=A0ABT9WPR8_9BACI|nr:serine hydrolase domain-containing protein [Bacillus chungangensis]MDQ0174947.1 CubicO group peptidase (beta-lactamase class C family) [Bacillus chungangensis]